MSNYKIIFSGPVGAGKTTAISALSDTPIISTNEQATDMTRERKRETTVAMDYGIMNLEGNERIHLYGTPGQERFNFMWDILVEGGIGLILLLNNHRPDPFKDLKFFLASFENFISDTTVAIGVTRMDEAQAPSLSDYHKYLETENQKFPVFEVDARERADVSLLVEALLYSLDPGLEA
ncbi:MAG: GTP-binding protein [Desulfobacterales bacterium]|nr:GTP-binding protein [Desulfobacterales bacterium]